MPPIRHALVVTLLALPLLAQGPAQPRLADPAATFCVDRMSGRFETERTPAGERGICVLRDGRRMDAWALFRAWNREVPEQEQLRNAEEPNRFNTPE